MNQWPEPEGPGVTPPEPGVDSTPGQGWASTQVPAAQQAPAASWDPPHTGNPQQGWYLQQGGNPQQPWSAPQAWPPPQYPVAPQGLPPASGTAAYQPPNAPQGWGQQGWGQQPGPPQQWLNAPPPPLTDRPSTPRPPSGRGWLVAVLGVVAVVLIGLVGALVVPSLVGLPARNSSAAGGPSPSSTSGTPGSQSTAAMPSDPEVILKKNPVYALTVPAHCPSQQIPNSPAAFRKQVKALMACENTAWRSALAATPVEFAKPKVTFYGSSTSSPCGHLDTTFPAAYCSSDRTLYFSTASYQQGRYYRLAVAEFVMHEYAHHVQELAGIFDSTWVTGEGDSLTSRRIELQAHCMAHYQLTHSGIGFSASDRADSEYQFGYSSDASGHGSVKAERYWGRRGLAAESVGACNTWKVTRAKVK
ncbi:MAG: neutral zinc metallopeptidase [Propionicimonas sp.]|uniref:neutral zinc metallopeptidase n=1 Tax=Propionicimonas sp. TaxID=1955623 RepID=UPI003D09BB28